MNGVELISQIRQNESGNYRSPIIAKTASTMHEDVTHCLESGADDVLPKPVTIEDLKQVMDKWLSSAVTARR